MKKRIFSFLSFISFILIVFGINLNDNIQKSQAANNTNIMNTWTTIKGPTTADKTVLSSSNTKIYITATTDPIVGYKDGNYTNQVDGLVGGDTFYVTIFMDCTSTSNMFSFGMCWDFNSDEIDTITDVISTNSYSNNIASETDNTSFLGFSTYYNQASVNWSNSATFSQCTTFMTNKYGHTGATYLEGEAKSVIYDNNMSSGANQVNNTGVKFNSATETGQNLTMNAGVYVVGKFKVKLKSGISTFSMSCNTMSVYEKKDVNALQWNNGYTGGGVADCSLYNASIGAGAASDKVDTSITVTDGSGSSSSVTNLTKSYSNSTLSNDFVFEIENGLNGYYLEATVDSGKGTVTGASSNATHVNTNAGTYKYNITDNINQNSYTTVTIDVKSQDSSKTEKYTIKIIRKANLSGLTLTKPSSSNLSNPVLSKSSNQNDYSSGTNKITNTSNLTPGTTYYIWVASSLTSYDVKYTHTGAGGTINNTQVSSGSSTSLQTSVGSFSIIIAADNTNVSSASVKTEYKFVVKQITEYTGMATPSVSVTGDSTTTGTSGTNGSTNVNGSTTSGGVSLSSGGTMYNFDIAYQDASGNKVTSVDVVAKPSNTANSKIYYSTDGGNTWSTPGSDYKVTLPLTENSNDGTASGTILYYVEDNTTGAVSKIQGVTVTRVKGDTDNTIKSISLYKVVNGADTLIKQITSGTTLDGGTHQLVDVSKIKIVVVANSNKVHSITIGGDQTLGPSATKTDTYTTTGTYTYPIKIKPQSGNDGEYEVKLTIEDNRTDIPYMKQFYVEVDGLYETPGTGSESDTVQNSGPLQNAVTLYYKVPYGTQSFKVTAVAVDGTVYKDNNDNGADSSITISSLTPGVATTYTYVVKTKMNNYSDVYKIVVTRETANSKVGMKDLYVNCGGQYTFTNIQTGVAFSDETNNLHTASKTLYFYTNLGTNVSGFSLSSIVANEVSNLNISLTPPASVPTLTSSGISITYKLKSEDGNVTVDYILYIYASDTISDFGSTGANISVLNSEKSGVVNGQVTGTPTLLQDCVTSDVYDKQYPISANDHEWTATINYSDRRVFIDYILNNNAKIYIFNGSSYTLFSGSNQDITCSAPASGSTQTKTTTITLYVFSELQLSRIAKESACGTNYATFVNSGDAAKYEFKFNVKPKCDKATLHDFTLTSGTGNVTFTPDDATATVIKIENIGSTTTLVFEVEKTCKTHDHKLTYASAQQFGSPVSLGNGKYEITYQCSLSSSTESTTLSIEKEDGTTLTYTIQFSSGASQLDQDKTLGVTTIVGFKSSTSASGTTAYNKVPNNTTAPGESASLAVGDTYVKITPKVKTGSLATIKLNYNFDGTSQYTNEPLDSSGDAYITVTPSNTQVTYLYLQIAITAEDTSLPTDYYYIKLEIPKVSDVNTVTQFKVDGIGKTPDSNNSTYFDISKTIKDNCSFSFTLDDLNSTATVNTQLTAISNIQYTLNNSNDNTNGILSGLALGENILQVVVTSSSGKQKTYFVYIWVNEDVYLDNLEVKSTDNQTTHTLSPAFSSNTNPYTTTVPYADTQENVYYTINNLDLNVIQVTYTIGNNTTINYFDGNNCALVTLASSGSTMINITVSQKFPTSWNSYQGTAQSSKTYNLEIKKQNADTKKDLLSIDIIGNLETTAHVYTQANLSTSNPITLVFDRDTSSIDLTNVTHSGKDISITITNNATYQAHVRQNNTDPYGWTLNSLIPNTKYTLTVTVKDEGGIPNDYVFYLILADESHDITDLKFVDVLGNPTTDDNNDQIAFQVTDLIYRQDTSTNPATINPYSFAANYAIIRVTKSKYSYLYVDGVIKTQSYGLTSFDITVDLSNVTAGNNIPVKIMVVSELEQIQPQNPQSKSDEYVVYVGKVQLDSNSSLHELNITIIGTNNSDITSSATVTGGYTPDQDGNYTISYSNVGDALKFTFSAIPYKATTYVKTNDAQAGVGQTLSDSVVLASSLNNGYILSYVIESYAQDGSKSTYTINITRGPLDPSDDNTITGLKFFDSASIYYVGDASNNPSVAVYDSINHVYPQPYGGYNIIIPYGTTSFTIDASVYAGSYAKVIFTKDGNTLTNTTQYGYQETISSSMWGNTYKYIVQAQSQSLVYGSQYAFIVTFETPNDNLELDELKVDNGANLIITGPTIKSADNLTWTWKNVKTVDYNTTYVNISAIIKDPTATILSSSDIGNCQLNVGLNTFVVSVQSQKGTIRKYILEITRNDKNPTLFDLEVTGQQLLDQNGQAVVFDPNVKEYYVTLPYSVTSAEVVAKITDTVNQIVYPGNSTTPSTVATVNVAPGTREIQTMRIYDQTSGLSTVYTVYIDRLNEDTVNADLDKVIIDKLDGGNNSIGGLDDKNNAIDSFINDWDKDKLHYGVYTVDDSISSLDIDATAVVNKPSTYCPNAATVEIFGGEQLQFGQNVISIVVTAPDGETQKVYDIIVYREPIAYEVDEEAIKEDGYKLTVNEELVDYTIDIGKKKTHEVDFKDYIKLLNDVTDQDVTINYLTNIECDPDDVILELVTEDGISTLVTFHVKSTGNSHDSSAFMDYLPLLIGLLLVIILLTAILISVNRDKYGKITRKADKKADKNQKDASKK